MREYSFKYGMVRVCTCYTLDVILQSLHLISSSSMAVSTGTDISEACQILQPKDQAALPIHELASCHQMQLEPSELWHGSLLKFQYSGCV